MTNSSSTGLVQVRIPAVLTLAGLIAGLLLGLLIAGSDAEKTVLAVSAPVGSLWLRALQMTIIPLVAALLIIGIAQMAQAAQAGSTARRTIGWIVTMLALSAAASCLLMPLLLEAFPVPGGAAGLLLKGGAAQPSEVPSLADFVTSLVSPNIVAAAAETAMLPLTVFFAALALAIVRLAEAQRELLLGFFRALGNAMLVIIGWVLWVAPVGVFALAVGVGAAGGGGAFATLLHYILAVIAMGGVVMVAGYVLAWLAGGISPLRFARGMLPANAVAISTQSSLASLPAMLISARRLGLRETTADFVLPLAVVVFRGTSPAMNLAVVIYVAHLAGVVLTPASLASGALVALIVSVGSVSLPGAISFIVATGPIAVAMGVPIEPLALLVAVEMLPDIMRTLGNVTTDVAVTAAVDNGAPDLDRDPAAEGAQL